MLDCRDQSSLAAHRSRRASRLRRTDHAVGTSEARADRGRPDRWSASRGSDCFLLGFSLEREECPGDYLSTSDHRSTYCSTCYSTPTCDDCPRSSAVRDATTREPSNLEPTARASEEVRFIARRSRASGDP